MPKKRGAPKGNQNARKHGFYSNAYTQSEKDELAQSGLDHRQTNFKFFKVLVARAARWVKPHPERPLTFHENLIALQVLVLAVNRLQSAVRYAHQLRLEADHEDARSTREMLGSLGMNEEEIDQEIFGILPPRRPGAQPGNQNALRHGFYASHYTPAELRKLDGLDENDLVEEIHLIQVLMKRVFAALDSPLSLADRFKAVRALAQADACLQRLSYAHGGMFTEDTFFNLLFEAVREANEKQGVRR